MDKRSRMASRARSTRSIPESQKSLTKNSNSIRMSSLDAPYGRQDRILRAAEAKEAAYITEKPAREYEGSTMPANHHNRGAALFDGTIAALSLYFAAFAFVAYYQDGTMASLALNQTIFRMASFNPTAFPILFTLVVSRFIKSFANFKLERGVTVGTVQHLLGSRTFVNSIMTPIRLGAMNFIVFGIFVLWCLDPLGGQMSLRTVSRDSNYTSIPMNFHYLDLAESTFTLVDNPSRLAPINSAFITALFSPVSSKNGTKDMFGNIHLPMIESLKSTQISDSQGWYRAGQLVQPTGSNKAIEALEKFLGLSNDAMPDSSVADAVYASLSGVPFARGGPVITPGYGVDANQTKDDTQATLTEIQASLFGAAADEVINVESQFNIETSYFSVDCTVRTTGRTDGPGDFPSGMDTVRGIVSNNDEFVIHYDFNHTMNSTVPRQLNLTSWSLSNGRSGDTTQANCELTTTYVEASVYCSDGNNCSIQAMRPSTLDHLPPVLSQLDGIAMSFNKSKPADRRAIPELFFSGFINATGNVTQSMHDITPTECYFVHPEAPFMCSSDGNDNALSAIGDKLFSQRFTQLLNTYWMDNVAPYSATGNFQLNGTVEGSKSATTSGQMRVETIVLRCHVPFMVILVIISILLFLLGMATAYLDYNRTGPDVFDDFVNSLRHNPYVHAEEGLSMEEGSDKARRLGPVLIRLGDVRPDDAVGYVAIGTPSEDQAVRMLQHDRRYR